MPCLRTSPERMSTSKASNRTLRVRSVASIAGSPQVASSLSPPFVTSICASVPTSHLHSDGCTIRKKIPADHTPTIAPQATSRQCRGTQVEGLYNDQHYL